MAKSQRPVVMDKLSSRASTRYVWYFFGHGILCLRGALRLCIVHLSISNKTKACGSIGGIFSLNTINWMWDKIEKCLIQLLAMMHHNECHTYQVLKLELRSMSYKRSKWSEHYREATLPFRSLASQSFVRIILNWSFLKTNRSYMLGERALLEASYTIYLN